MTNPVTRGNINAALLPVIYEFFGEGYNRYEKQHEQIFTVKKSTRAFEEHVMNFDTGVGAQKTEGSMITYDTLGEGFKVRYQHNTYALGIIITKEAIEDDQYVDLAKRASTALGKSLSYTKEVVAANVLNNALSGSFLGGDGKSLGATDHPLYGPGGGTYANKFSAATSLSETALEAAITNIRGFVDERGMLVNVQPRKLVVPKELAFTAHRILRSPYRTNTADNDVNVIADKNLFSEGYIINNYLTSAVNYFVQDGFYNI